jgi:diguanylate cyclase (GGDEF)-like protein
MTSALQTHRWFSFFVLGLLSILIGMFFFIFNFQQLTRTNTENARVAFNTSSLYEQASFLVVNQELYEQKYLANPTVSNYNSFQSSIAALNNNIIYMIQHSQNNDRQSLQNILVIQQHYQDAAQQVLAAIGEKQTQLAIDIDEQQVSPLYLVLQQDIDDASTKEHAQALSHMNDIVTTESQSSTLLPAVCIIGIALLIIMGILLYRFQRSLAQAQQREVAHFKRSSLTDNLTQLGNHRAYHETYHQEIENAQQHGETFSLALIDVDEFKQYNDLHGHAYGDHILTTLSHILGSSRPEDLAFRLGGDEFAMILRHTEIEQATRVLEHLRESVHQHLSGVTISIGIATLGSDASNINIVQEQSDAALYEAKRRGRNRLVTFPEIEGKVALFTSTQAQALRDLLQEKEITIVFQPIWDLDRLEILAFEALMRPHAKYQFAGPQETFDIAQRMGHIHELDAICYEAILTHAQELPPKTLLFINLSPQTLEQTLFTDTTIFDLISTAGLRPEQVVLEITERAITRPEVVVREAKRLRDQGFKLALDDAGVGNSGLEMLSQLAMDYVKVDRSIISKAAKATTDTTARAVLAGIAAIAQETKSLVIAEGIEDLAMLEFVHQFSLLEYKIHAAQGYFLGRPNKRMIESSEITTLPPHLHAA